jgi:hypothetical protein
MTVKVISDKVEAVVDNGAQYINDAPIWKMSTMPKSTMRILMSEPRYIRYQRVVVSRMVLSFDCYWDMMMQTSMHGSTPLHWASFCGAWGYSALIIEYVSDVLE